MSGPEVQANAIATALADFPLRSASDRAALVEALADGTLDCIATDHAPHRADEKEQPFEAAPNGVIGLETAFAAVYTHLVAPGLVLGASSRPRSWSR